MLRTCPRCGDFYADASLLFCLADGTPLVDVDPHGGSWAEGARVVEEKERATRRRARRLRLRRVMSMTTALITTAVVLAFAVNTYVYVVTEPGAPVVAVVTPTPTPTRRGETPEWTPTPDTTSTNPFVPAVTPTPTPSPTPRTPTPTPTPTPRQCTANDKQRLEGEIAAANSGDWERAIDTESERARIARENLPDRAIEPSVKLLKPLGHAVTFSNACEPLSVKVSYTWEVKWGSNPLVKSGEKRVDGSKTFACGKSGKGWRCG